MQASREMRCRDTLELAICKIEERDTVHCQVER